MSTVKIGRYEHESVTAEFAGWIEPADKSWIIYLGADGRPSVYYAERDETGAVTSEAVVL